MTTDTDKTVDIDQLERLLGAYEDLPVEILPDGTMRITGEPSKPKPITLRKNLGGEYSAEMKRRVRARIAWLKLLGRLPIGGQ